MNLITVEVYILGANVIVFALNIFFSAMHIKHIGKELQYIKGNSEWIKDQWIELLNEVKRSGGFRKSLGELQAEGLKCSKTSNMP